VVDAAIDSGGEHRSLGPAAGRLMAIGAAVALAGVAGSYAWATVGGLGAERFWQSYLVAFAFWLSIALGGLFFVTLQHLTRAGWSVSVRRTAEAIAQNVQLLALLFLPILLLAMPELYHWAEPGAAEHDELIRHKQPYLNQMFFTIRWIVYFVVWIALAGLFYRRSLAQDRSGDSSLTLSMERVSAPGMVLFALTLTFASFDLLMSLDSHWFSTIFGVYYFSGSTLAIFSVLALCMWALQRSGRIEKSVTTEHYHDLGKFMFGFVVFWAYIAFSQYMLIWYGDIPEETGWYLRRQTGGWATLGLVLIFGHFLLPFLLLINRSVKRRKGQLAFMAVWLLVLHWIDLYWIAMPEFSAPGEVPLHAIDVLVTLGMGGLFVAFTAHKLRGCSLVPDKDPRLSESLALDNA
jgi:hypothetical protein